MFHNGLLVEAISHPSDINILCVLQHVLVLSGGVAMDSVSHPPNVVMETGSAQMGVMNSIAVSIVLFACLSHTFHAHLVECVHNRVLVEAISHPSNMNSTAVSVVVLALHLIPSYLDGMILQQ